MPKPDLSLYLGRKVKSVGLGVEENEWFVELDGGVKFMNKSSIEDFAPGEEIVGSKFVFISMSLHDTTLHFMAPNGHVHKISFAPTYYVIVDPVHGGQVYPQWPEELEDSGVPATPEGGISDKPMDERAWEVEHMRLRNSREARVQGDAAAFLAEEEGN